MGALLAFHATPAVANPAGGTVTTGSATISSPSAKQTNVDQTSEGVVIDWSSFNIGRSQTTNFVQPNAQAIAINRIGGSNPAQILGTLDANGRVVLIDGNGIAFGRNSQVNVGSLIATTTGGSDSDLLAGKFTKAGNQNASVVNRGTITAAGGGTVALVAPNVTNRGTVQAKLGTVSLGAANAFTVDFAGDGLVSFAAQGDVNGKAQVTNAGTLSGANVSMTARAAEGVATGVVNVRGTIQAQGAHNVGGTIVLDAGDGGSIDVSHASLNASGAKGGGTVTIGGWNQSSVVVDKHSIVNVSATKSGNGGTIDVTAAATSFRGQALASGGAQSGNGGNIETSGHVLDVNGAWISATAAHGATGNWLLDPENVTISTAASSTDSCTSDLCTPTGDNSVLNVTTLENALAKANVTVTTGSTGSQAGDITVLAPLTWSAHILTLDAYHSIDVDATISATNTAELSLKTDDGGSGGDYYFNGGNITFASLSQVLDINDRRFTLVDSIAQLASDIAATPSGRYALAGTYNAKADGTYDGSPIPTEFKGTFTGLGNSISDLTISAADSTSPIGLFEEIKSTGIVRDLGLLDADVTGGTETGALVGLNEGTVIADSAGGTVTGNSMVGGLVGSNSNILSDSWSSADVIDTAGTDKPGDAGSLVGGLVGFNESDGTVIGSYATGSVTALKSSDVSGLVGRNSGTIESSYSTGEVQGYNAVGGVAGNLGGTIEDESWSSSTLYGNKDVGGLVGYAKGVIDDSFADGTVNAAGDYSGGLVGQNVSATISQSFSTAAVNGTDDAGGLVGDNSGAIENSYAMGNVSGGVYVGGLVGDNTAPILDSFATGMVSGGTDVGGFAGENSGSLSHVYWDTDTSGTLTGVAKSVSGASGSATSASTQSLQAGLNTSWSTSIWGIDAGVSYPYLLWQAPSGTPEVVAGIVANGATPVSGASVGLSIGGTVASPLAAASSGANGYYYLLLAPGTIPNSNGQVLAYISGGTTSPGNAFYQDATGSLTNLGIQEGEIAITSDQSTASGMMADLNTAVGSGTGSQFLYTQTRGFSSDIEAVIDDTATSFTIDTALDFAGDNVTLNSTGAIAETTGSLDALSLVGGSAGGAALGGANMVRTLDAFTNTGSGGFSLSDGETLTVSGAVNAGTGNLSLTTTSGNIDIASQLTAGTEADLVSAGTVSESGSGAISAAQLAGSSAGEAAFGGSNMIGTLNAFTNTGSGGFSLSDGETLTVSGALNAGADNLSLTTTSGDLDIANQLTTSAEADLVSAGTITEGGSGAISAAKFTGSSAGGATLNGANLIGTLEAFTNSGAGGFALTNSETLTTDDTINAGTGDMTLTTTGADNDIVIKEAITAGGTITLDSAGDITETTATGTITAATLTGSAGGATTLNGANQIASLGDFASTGGHFALNDGQALTVSGTVNAAGQNITLQTTSGNLLVNGALDGDTITLGSSLGEVEGAGTITASELNVTADTGIDLTGPNDIKKIGTNQTNSGPDIINQ